MTNVKEIPKSWLEKGDWEDGGNGYAFQCHAFEDGFISICAVIVSLNEEEVELIPIFVWDLPTQ